MPGVLGDRGTLAIAIFSRGQHRLLLVAGHQQRDHLLAIFQVHAAHAARSPAHRAHVVLVEADCLSGIGEQHHVAAAIGQRGADQEVAFIKVNSDDAGLARIAELGQRGLLDCAQRGRHEHIAIFRERAVGAE